MDTTSKYKTQCKAAFEDIGFIWNEGPDNLLIVDDDELLRTCLNSKEKIEHYHGELFTISGQLYRQDQLQESLRQELPVKYHFDNWIDLILGDWYFWQRDIPGTYEISFEQRWLMFVMHKKFGKTWDSDKEQWVKEG